MRPTAVFTDLDGTLLNHDDYSYRDALPAIERLKSLDIPIILVSSKTRPEMAGLSRELALDDPYVCENGSLVVLPAQWAERFGVDTADLELSGDDYLAYWGASRPEILSLLQSLKGEFSFTGFADMGVGDVVDATGLDERRAAMAMERCASEPLLWHDSDAAMARFAQRLGENGLRVLKGGRFFHVMAQCDKGDAVRYLLSIYESHIGAKVGSIALGDSPNDLQMLKAVDRAVIMPHPDGTYMHDDELSNAVHAPFAGAKGWNSGVEAALAKLEEEAL